LIIKWGQGVKFVEPVSARLHGVVRREKSIPEIAHILGQSRVQNDALASATLAATAPITLDPRPPFIYDPDFSHPIEL